MTRRRRFLWILGGVWALPGCVCTLDPGPEEIEKIGARNAPEPFARHQAQVVIESEAFSGEFLGVLLVRARPLAVRLQLFPDIGGKVLDVAATPQRQIGVLPMTGSLLEHPGGPGDRLLEMFATSILEAHAPIDAGRVECSERIGDDGVRLELRPRFGASRCRLTARGSARTYDIVRRGSAWRLHLDGAGGIDIAARGFSLRARVQETESLADIPDGSFELRSR